LSVFLSSIRRAILSSPLSSALLCSSIFFL
jgi:hypothetical protein